MDTNKITNGREEKKTRTAAPKFSGVKLTQIYADMGATPWSAASLARPKGVATQRFDLSHDIESA